MIKVLPLIIKRSSSFTVLPETEYNVYGGSIKRMKIMSGKHAKSLKEAIEVFGGKMPFVIFDGEDKLVTNENEMILALVEFS
jgi:hypothetical protein